jgi:hypothetical protein
LFARAPGFPLRLLETFTGALQLFLGNAYALLRYFRLQPGPFRGLRRRGFSISRFFGGSFAAGLLHPRACDVGEGAQVSHKPEGVATVTKRPRRSRRTNLSTEFVHKYVDRLHPRAQSAVPAMACVSLLDFSPGWRLSAHGRNLQQATLPFDQTGRMSAWSWSFRRRSGSAGEQR